MRPLGDRRVHTRFEVVGALFGVLQVMEPASIVDISLHGALISSPTPVAVGSSQSLALDMGGRHVPVPVTVRHVRPAPYSVPPQFHIGVEFVSIPDAVLQSMGLSAESAAE